LNGPVLVQANHHVADRFAGNNEDLREVPEGEEEFSIEGSTSRSDTLARTLAEVQAPCTLETAATALDVPIVLNRHTCQRMVFCPGTGEVKVWRRAR
jgi:hypothetical protein